MAPKREVASREPRPEKVQEVEELVSKLKDSNGTVITDYRGMSVKSMEQLRGVLRAQGASYQIVKNTLLRRAADELDYSGLNEWLEGPSAAIFLGSDIVAPTKALVDFVKTNANLPAIKGGFVEGRSLDAVRVRSLANLPSREMLLAMLVGTLQSPMGGLLSTLQAAMGELAATLQSLSDTKATA